jgi:hypothetical protein
MNITMKPYAKNENPKNTYIIVCSVMHGDADKYEDFEFDFSKKESFMMMLERLLAILEKGSCKSRQLMSDLEKEFCEKVDKGGFDEDLYFEWPGDVTCDQQYRVALTAISDLIYYDENGNKFKILVDDKERIQCNRSV